MANKPRTQADSEKRMAFFDHLDELRTRLTRCTFVFLAGFTFCYMVTNEWVLEILRRPLFRALPPDQQKLYFTSLFENFFTHLKIAGYSSVILLCPYFFFELWGFLAPGLYAREKKLVIPFLGITTLFFLMGSAFAYFVLFPVGFKFFVTYGGPQDVPLLTIDSYYGTCLKLIVLFGAAFELPVLLCLLGYLGLIDAPMLRAQRKTAILAITLVSAFVAPPDAISMLLLMAPLWLMFEGSILVISRFDRPRRSSEPSYRQT